MDNKCPKCGKKLSIFYIKAECPECGCDINYYDYENRLEKDAEQAEKEFEWLNKMLDKYIGPIMKAFKKK